MSLPRHLRPVGAALSIVLATGLLAGAGTVAQSPAASATPVQPAPLTGETITVYNAQHEELTQAWADAFTAADRHRDRHAAQR